MSGITYAFSTGPDELEHEAHLLLNSIQSNTSARADDILIYVIEDEIPLLSDELLSYFNQNATVVKGSLPNPDYPLSAAHGALVAASNETENDYTLLLDTDTLVLDDIEIHNSSEAELFVAPAALGNRYWASSESTEDWKTLYNKYGFDFPTSRVRSLVDDQVMLPYYNGGVILTANNDFPERWMNLSREIHGTLPKSNYFSEMVALALLSSDYTVEVLGERYNYTLPRHLTVPTDIRIVHYIEYNCVRRAAAIDRNFNAKLKKIGIPPELEPTIN